MGVFWFLLVVGWLFFGLVWLVSGIFKYVLLARHVEGNVLKVVLWDLPWRLCFLPGQDPVLSFGQFILSTEHEQVIKQPPPYGS